MKIHAAVLDSINIVFDFTQLLKGEYKDNEDIIPYTIHLKRKYKVGVAELCTIYKYTYEIIDINNKSSFWESYCQVSDTNENNYDRDGCDEDDFIALVPIT